MKYNIVDYFPFVSRKEIILQGSLGKIQVKTQDPNALLIYMGPSPVAHNAVIALDRRNIDLMIQALQWAKLTEGDFFIHAKRYFRKHKKLTADDCPKTKQEILQLQNEFDDWCLENEKLIRKRIAKDKADSVKGTNYSVRKALKECNDSLE